MKKLLSTAIVGSLFVTAPLSSRADSLSDQLIMIDNMRWAVEDALEETRQSIEDKIDVLADNQGYIDPCLIMPFDKLVTARTSPRLRQRLIETEAVRQRACAASGNSSEIARMRAITGNPAALRKYIETVQPIEIGPPR